MKLALIPSPFALAHFGVDSGRTPQALLEAGLERALEADGHVVSLVGRDLDLGPGETLDRIGRNSWVLAEAVAEACQVGATPIILGGDCLVAVGMCAGLRSGTRGEFGIVWFDAHGDFNTPDTTLSGYLGGMPLACVCGRGLATLRSAAGLSQPIDETRVTLVGTRDLDPPEKALLDTTPVRIVPPDAVEHFQAASQPTYLHFDMDAIDPRVAPGVNYPSPGGLVPETAVQAARQVRPHLVGLALAAINPDRDPSGQTIRAAVQIVRDILA